MTASDWFTAAMWTAYVSAVSSCRLLAFSAARSRVRWKPTASLVCAATLELSTGIAMAE